MIVGTNYISTSTNVFNSKRSLLVKLNPILIFYSFWKLKNYGRGLRCCAKTAVEVVSVTFFYFLPLQLWCIGTSIKRRAKGLAKSVHYIEVLFHVSYYDWGKENRSLYRGVRSLYRGSSVVKFFKMWWLLPKLVLQSCCFWN